MAMTDAGRAGASSAAHDNRRLRLPGSLRAPAGATPCYFRESVSHIERRGRLLVVGTPIGNLEDLSPRARRALSEADVIFCEDTRVTAKLTARFSIPAPRISCPAPREGARVEELLERLSRGETVALVSDAGMPGMSDPGERLVAAAAEAGHVVEVVPGPSAPAAALAISGLPAVPHVFLGFLPARQGERRRALEALRSRTETLVWFEAPHRLRESLEDAARGPGPPARQRGAGAHEAARGSGPRDAAGGRRNLPRPRGGPRRNHRRRGGRLRIHLRIPYDGRCRREDSRGPGRGRGLEAPVQGDRAAGRPAGAGDLLARAAALPAFQHPRRSPSPIPNERPDRPRLAPDESLQDVPARGRPRGGPEVPGQADRDGNGGGGGRQLHDRARGDGRLHRRQRRRQVHHDQDADRHPDPDVGRGVLQRLRALTASARATSPRSGWSSASARNSGGTSPWSSRSACSRRSTA